MGVTAWIHCREPTGVEWGPSPFSSTSARAQWKMPGNWQWPPKKERTRGGGGREREGKNKTKVRESLSRTRARESLTWILTWIAALQWKNRAGRDQGVETLMGVALRSVMNPDKQNGPAWPKQGCLWKRRRFWWKGRMQEISSKGLKERTQDQGGSSEHELQGSWERYHAKFCSESWYLTQLVC